MITKSEKQLIAGSFVWFIISLPLSYHFYNEGIGEESILLLLFSFLIVNSPVWLIYGIRWATERAVNKKELVAYLFLCFLGFGYLDSHSDSHGASYIPVSCGFGFLFLFLLDRRKDNSFR